MKTADQPKATPTCIVIPSATVRAPPMNAAGPISVDATPCHRREIVDPKKTTLRTLANNPSLMAVVTPARSRRVSMGPTLEMLHLQHRRHRGGKDELHPRIQAGTQPYNGRAP